MKKSNQVQNTNYQESHGFASGLMLGAVAGVVSYYFFGTKQGSKLKNQLIAEFEKAKSQIPPDLLSSSSTLLNNLEKEIPEVITTKNYPSAKK